MNKILVAVFDREAAAYEGLAALKDLHRDGDITLYSSAVLAKGTSGGIDIKQQADQGPVGTAVGLLSGALIGILAGPVGMAIGATLGSMTGLLVDASKTGVDLTFVDDVAGSLTPGKVAVLAEIDEGWTAPVDTRLHNLGGTVFRRLRGEVIEDQLTRESEALQAEMRMLDDELKQAAADDRAAIQKDIDRVKSDLEATRARAKATLDQARAETQAKLKALETQAATARGLAKARVEKRLAATKANFEVRSHKLEQAWALTKEALAA